MQPPTRILGCRAVFIFGGVTLYPPTPHSAAVAIVVLPSDPPTVLALSCPRVLSCFLYPVLFVLCLYGVKPFLAWHSACCALTHSALRLLICFFSLLALDAFWVLNYLHPLPLNSVVSTPHLVFLFKFPDSSCSESLTRFFGRPVKVLCAPNVSRSLCCLFFLFFSDFSVFPFNQSTLWRQKRLAFVSLVI